MPLNLAAARPLLAGALLFSALTACGGDSDSSEAASPAHPTSDVRTSSEPDDDADARRTVKAAVIQLFRDGTGTYTTGSRIPGATESSEEGRYDLVHRAWSMERYVSAPNASAYVEIRRLREGTWMRMDAGAPQKQHWDCWVGTDGLRDPETGSVAIPRSSPVPPPVLVADGLIGRERTPAGFTGTVLLTSAIQLLNSKLIASGDLDARTKSTVPVDVTVVDGRLRMITLQMVDLFAPLAEMKILPATPEQVARIGGEIQVTFDDVGAPVSIRKPADVGTLADCAAA